jgi:hypothetical protein
MDKVREFRQRAAECRELANVAALELRAHYDELAAIWDLLAEERVRFFIPHAQAEATGPDLGETTDCVGPQISRPPV